MNNEFNLQLRVKAGANWFFVIAVLSLIQFSIFILVGANILNFGVGSGELPLGILGLFDMFVGMAGGSVAWIITIAGNVLYLVFFIIMGIYSRKNQIWAFNLGASLYSLEMILLSLGVVHFYASPLSLFGAIIETVYLALRVYALVCLISGLIAANKLESLQNN